MHSKAISGLRWALGLIILLESVHFALSGANNHQFARNGLPPWVPMALGGSEAVAAMLFLIPAAELVGSWALLFIFAIAIVIHFLHGQFEVGSLVIYGIAVVVCLTNRSDATMKAPHDR